MIQKSYSQTKISGKLLDESGHIISNVSVSYKKIGTAFILGFAKSNDQGVYNLSINLPNVDSVQLTFNHLSYVSKLVTIANKNATESYLLISRSNRLKEVKIAEVPIYKRKDTINYNVESFSSKQDRVIGDIIKKLPGIEMHGGQILYQGKPIQQYRVNGLDLMGGRYGMINQNLPADAVLKVQILENHQPIKVLDSLVFSDRATLNLELKKFTSTGTAQVGAGTSPLLWDVRVTPMTFAKNFQMLNSLQTNNIGDDISEQLRPFYSGDNNFTSRSSFSDGPTFINIRGVSTPGFDQKKWLKNQIFLFSSNMLQRLKNDIQIKRNFSYFHDNRKLQGITSTQYFSGGQTIQNQEMVNNHFSIDELNIGLLVEKNEANVYLRNSTSYRKHWNNSLGDLIFNENIPIQQKKNFTDEAFLNSLSIARYLGKQLINFRSTLEWHSTPQRLSVSPGQFQKLLNDGQDYDKMGQLVQYGSFSFENGVSLMRSIKGWKFSTDMNLNYRRKYLDTHIEIEDAGAIKRVGVPNYFNNMDYSQLQLGLSLSILKESRKLKYRFNLPFNQFYYNVKQVEVQSLKNEYRNTWNPSTNLTYLVNTNNNISLNLYAGNQYGGLDNIYNGYIISEYRSIQRYDTRLLKNNQVGGGINYEYKNTLKANFANLGYTYKSSWRDYVLNTILDSLGRSSTSISDNNSSSINHGIRGGISHLFMRMKTVAKLNGNLNWSISDYQLNAAMGKQYVYNQSLTFELINTCAQVISGEYKLSLGRTENRLIGNQVNKLLYNNQVLNVIIAPYDRHLISISNSLFGNNMKGQKSQYFMDAVYRFRIDTWHVDIEFSAMNVLNNRNYQQQFSSNYELVQSYFALRPRQFLVSMKFKI